ncbi:helix-turn-helix transcriptional regulator [Arthrobacter sp. H14]|uniref:helix-turn-helix transcriptional regulator n=1 Tax=Arthrobacter sp. H14 TaxID=1312959 RepID=UPI00068753C7|nr:helix-turn-helix domain-containing protein [Arthrobacter sp. H14]
MYSVSHSSSGPVGSEETEERTRDKVLGAVLEHGPVSAAVLGEILGFTPAAVRRHLDALSRDGLIEVKLVSKATGAGRPSRRYVLTKRGQQHLGNDYLDIARDALTQLTRIAGPAAVEDFARRRYAEMEERYRPIVDAAGSGVEARTRALAEALSQDRYSASSTTVPAPKGSGTREGLGSVQLCQGHCPVQDLAAEFPIFCETETQVFARLIGVDVRRLSTLASGGHVCTTHVPTGRASTNPAQ